MPINPAPQTAKIDKHDVWILVGIGFGSMVLLVGFWIWLQTSGLISYPSAQSIDEDSPFFKDVLAFRERSVALAMLLMTFVTAFSFIVGIVMATYGGLFILRQVVALTTISASLGGDLAGGGVPGPDVAPQAGANGIADRVATAAREAAHRQVAFTSYSPGVVFMLGGVVVMVATQWMAIRIQIPEILPSNYVAACAHEETGQMVPCQLALADAETIEYWMLHRALPPTVDGTDASDPDHSQSHDGQTPESSNPFVTSGGR